MESVGVRGGVPFGDFPVSFPPSHPNYETHISAMMCLHGPKAAWPTKHIQYALKLDPNKLFLCVNCLKYFINNNKSLPDRSKMETTKRLTKIYFIKQLNLLSTKLNLSYLKCNVLKKNSFKMHVNKCLCYLDSCNSYQSRPAS